MAYNPPMKLMESRAFHERAVDLLGDLELWKLQEHVTLQPEAGKRIPGGKGLRVIYYYRVKQVIYFMAIYPKSEREDLSALELKVLAGELEDFEP